MSDKVRVSPFQFGNYADEGDSVLPSDAALKTIVDAERRAVVAALQSKSPLDVTELASHVVKRQRGCPLESITDEERQRASTALYHNHLPRLEDAGIVERTRRDDEVLVHLAEGAEAGLLDAIDVIEDHDDGESVHAVLSDPSRRRVLTLLERANQSVSLTTLAEAVAADEVSAADEPEGAAFESARVSLHHIHLPMLEDTGLVEYDPAERRVESKNVPEALSELLAA